MVQYLRRLKVAKAKQTIGTMKVTQDRRDPKKRFKGISLPVDLCVKIEQLVGVEPGQKPDYIQKLKISDYIISALEKATASIQLVPENQEAVKKEIKGKAMKRR